MKNLIKLTLFALTLISFSFIDLKKEKETINIVIDAGHGGSDFGATHREASEKQIVESITRKMQTMNTDLNLNIHLTRIGDKMTTLKERVEIIDNINPDLVISLHTNSTKNAEVNGVECYVSDKPSTFDQSNVLAEKFLTSISLKTPFKINGVKKAPFYILKKTEVPAILIELGYLSNANDKAYLLDDKGQNEIAQQLLDFVSQLKS